MAIVWRDDQPIYRQVRERVLGLIMSGAIKEGEALPSVRQVSADYQINHLTVAKAYQELVDDALVEMRRGLGMFVVPGARERVLRAERDKFLDEELPELARRLRQLGITRAELVKQLAAVAEE